MWKNFDTEFVGILKSLRRHKELVECRANLTQYRRYKEDMIELTARLDQQVAEEKLKKLVAVKAWLAVGQQPEEDHIRFKQTRDDYSTTAKWILDHEYVKHWMEADLPSSPLLWMHGIPGAGKSSFSLTQSAAMSVFSIVEGPRRSKSECTQLYGLLTQKRSNVYCSYSYLALIL